METVKINVPFEAVVEHGENLFGHVTHPYVSMCGYGKASSIKKDFQGKLAALVNDGLQALRNTESRLIACQSGEVIVVRFAFGSWQYTITRQGQHGSTCVTGQTFDKVCEAARSHANTSYGGIAWESYI